MKMKTCTVNVLILLCPGLRCLLSDSFKNKTLKLCVDCIDIGNAILRGLGN